MEKQPHAMLSMDEEKNFITPNIMLMLNHSVSLKEENLCNVFEERKVTSAEIIACTISVLTIIENLTILAAIIKGPRSLRKPPYWFIASLAAADLLTGVEVIVAIFIKVGTSPQSRIVLKVGDDCSLFDILPSTCFFHIVFDLKIACPSV